ncbi:unnamed protein product [Dibothriocephalus latus]|uniref:Multiple inositol polyphosphate phosphatase 1 n=1 Tax=Dibothriocephalus latus TaxID=60516 RepID=A0A3P7KYX8_DIBLA|nr:unnamed protein product [Dibothriocephalus latus]
MRKYLLKLLALFLCWWRWWKYYDSNLTECYSLNAMGSKTAYVNNGLASSREPYKTDRLAHVNMLFRHGTRSPDDKFIKQMEKLAERFKSRKELSDFKFTFNCRGSESKQLLPTGVRELEDLGLRWRDRIPESFHQPSDVEVYVSPTPRTRDSARAFISKVRDLHFAALLFMYLNIKLGSSSFKPYREACNIPVKVCAA